jgi:ABC-2 type transport system permease protein
MSERVERWGVVRAFAATDARILWRMRTPVIFLFAVPALLSLLLGSAVSGDPTAFPGRSVIGFAVLFSFMTINYMGLALFREFAGHTWLRQAVYKPPRSAFLAGKLGPVVAMGLLQLVVFAVLTFLVYPLPLHGDVLQLVVVAVPLACCGPVIGVLLYNLTSSVSTFQSVTYLVMLGMGGLGGTIVTPERLPAPARVLGPFTPHHWAIEAFTNSTVGSGSWALTWQYAGIVAAITALVGVAAHVTFDFRSEKLSYA